MPKKMLYYSIQRTYTLTETSKSERKIVTCNQRIDIPTIEPLPNTEFFLFKGVQITLVPCIEIVGNFLDVFDLTFETNEGVTVLPIKISPAQDDPIGNPYTHYRYVLVLPRGATGVKSCRLTPKGNGETVKEFQHNLTFGIMSPPYNYDNALFGILSGISSETVEMLFELDDTVSNLKLTTQMPTFAPINLPKGAGKQTIDIENSVLFYETGFNYPLSPEPTIHKPKITLRGGGRDFVYTLSLNKTTNTVSIDLLTGMITVYDGVTGEIMQQFKLPIPNNDFNILSFEGFDDIDDSALRVVKKGAYVK